MFSRTQSIMKLPLPELFKLLESKGEWDDYYFSIENDFRIPASVGRGGVNMPKNRYCNVWPWNKNRVVLKGPHDYINGSHVRAPIVDQHYICTQEPLTGNDSTKDDFWTMVWEQNCCVVIMLNDPKENNSYKSEKYYPYYPTGVSDYQVYSSCSARGENIKVTLLSKENHGSYVSSKLELTVGDHPPRQLNHLQFEGWRDYEIPSSASEFFKFLMLSREYYEGSGGPPIVHCSAGVGRTGTFVLADVILRIAAEKKSLNIDLVSVLEYLRSQRMWMVQTPEQLRLCFLVILEGVKEFDLETFSKDRITV